MPTSGEAREIVGAGVDLLHEGRFGVHQSIVRENSMNLCDHLHRREYVLQDRLHNDCVDAAGSQWNGVRVGDQLGEAAAVKVESDHLDICTSGVEAVQAVPAGPTANNEHAAGSVRQHVEQPRDVVFGDVVERLPDAAQ